MSASSTTRPVLCACGWTGDLASRVLCPDCGMRSRILTPNLDVLLALYAGQQPAIEPGRRIWLRDRGLIVMTQRIAPSDVRRTRAPVRTHALTTRGTRVVAAHMARTAQTDHHSQETAA